MEKIIWSNEELEIGDFEEFLKEECKKYNFYYEKDRTKPWFQWGSG